MIQKRCWNWEEIFSKFEANKVAWWKINLMDENYKIFTEYKLLNFCLIMKYYSPQQEELVMFSDFFPMISGDLFFKKSLLFKSHSL